MINEGMEKNFDKAQTKVKPNNMILSYLISDQPYSYLAFLLVGLSENGGKFIFVFQCWEKIAAAAAAAGGGGA
jgi:hypothetical protein